MEFQENRKDINGLWLSFEYFSRVNGSMVLITTVSFTLTKRHDSLAGKTKQELYMLNANG